MTWVSLACERGWRPRYRHCGSASRTCPGVAKGLTFTLSSAERFLQLSSHPLMPAQCLSHGNRWVRSQVQRRLVAGGMLPSPTSHAWRLAAGTTKM